MEKDTVVSGVKSWIEWWIETRESKLTQVLSETMSINPFLMPVLSHLHGLDDFEGLVKLLVAGHLMTGHSTGFGKLMDEKILPQVFGTTKLDAQFRRTHTPFSEACFDEIDHIVHIDGKTALLSLKSSRWSIQLTMAVQINAAFNHVLNVHSDICDHIIVGVVYGKRENLTDKYDILRGINRGARHEVIDLTDRVEVYSGRRFWEWISGGHPDAQDWVLEGILQAIGSRSGDELGSQLISNYEESVVDKYGDLRFSSGAMDWGRLLTEISG